MASKCKHSLAKQETACADGMCPLCLAKDIIKFNDKCVAMRRRLEAENRALHKDIKLMNEELAEASTRKDKPMSKAKELLEKRIAMSRVSADNENYLIQLSIKEAEEIIQALAALEPEQPCDWIPVGVRLPEENADFVLVTNNEKYALGWYNNNHWSLITTNTSDLYDSNITHWKPIVLPEPTCQTCGGSGGRVPALWGLTQMHSSEGFAGETKPCPNCPPKPGILMHTPCAGESGSTYPRPTFTKPKEPEPEPSGEFVKKTGELMKKFYEYQNFVHFFLHYLRERGIIKGTRDTVEDIKIKLLNRIAELLADLELARKTRDGFKALTIKQAEQIEKLKGNKEIKYQERYTAARFEEVQDNNRQRDEIIKGYETVMRKCIKAMEGSNCLESQWLTEALKGE